MAVSARVSDSAGASVATIMEVSDSAIESVATMAASDSAGASVATTMEVSDSAIESVATKVVQGLGYEAMKHEQLQIVTGVLRGRDVFGVLPTGFGKTLCFTCLPVVYDKLYQTVEPSIVLVVSPLIATMKDQVSKEIHCT